MDRSDEVLAPAGRIPVFATPISLPGNSLTTRCQTAVRFPSTWPGTHGYHRSESERTGVARVRQEDKTNALGRIPLFSDLSKKELVFLARMTTEVDVREGSTLVRQGEMGREAMIIESGTAVVRRNNRKVDDVGPGDFFGEMSLIDHMPRNADVVATSDMTVLVMDSREFSTVLDTYPKVAVKILKTVVERLVQAQSTPI